ncbi:MAG: hypothetical protein U1E21_16410 [Reyranellaceae bacterium]
MAKYCAKFAKGRPYVVDVDGKDVPGAVVKRLNFPMGPVDVVGGRKWGPEHRPLTVDIEVNGAVIRAVPVRSIKQP